MAHGISIDIQFREIFDVLINNGEAADALTVPETSQQLRLVPGTAQWTAHASHREWCASRPISPTNA